MYTLVASRECEHFYINFTCIMYKFAISFLDDLNNCNSLSNIESKDDLQIYIYIDDLIITYKNE